MSKRKKTKSKTKELKAQISPQYPIDSAQVSEWFTAGSGVAGVHVNERTAISVSAVYACVSLISGSVASLPIHIYPREGDRERVTGLRIGEVLNQEYAPEWPAASAKEHHMGSVLLHGDGFARIYRQGPDPVAIRPLSATQVSVQRQGGRLKYTFWDIDRDAQITLDQDDVLHFPGLGYNGLRGMTPLQHWLRMSSGIAIAADEHSASFFGNGARPDFVLRTDGALKPPDVDVLRRTWEERYGGPSRAYLPAVLSGGLDVKPLTLNHDDAQLIATRRFQVEEIARIFGCPQHMIGHTEKQSAWGTGIEQMSIGYVKYTLSRHLKKLEQEFNRKLFRGSNLGRYFCEFITAGLERGDTKGRFDAYRSALGRAGEPGWITVNEIRRLENLPPQEGGDELNWTGEANAE